MQTTLEQEEENSMLYNNKLDTINKFFISLYGVELKDTNTYYIPLIGKQAYVEGTDIYVDSNMPEIDQEIATVHEYNHVYQDMGYSVTVHDIEDAKIKDLKTNYACKRLEIDSRIVELLYVDYVFGDYGLNLMKKRLYKGCSIFTPNIEKSIFELKDCHVKDVLVKEIDEAYVTTTYFKKGLM